MSLVWCRSAARNGSVDAAHALGVMYDPAYPGDGMLAEKDPEEAAHFYYFGNEPAWRGLNARVSRTESRSHVLVQAYSIS